MIFDTDYVLLDKPDLRANRDSGQLWLDDRKLLWNIVRNLSPGLAVETGTWKGGGSTFFISSAMHMNGFGKLFSVERDERIFNQCVHRYSNEWLYLSPFVDFSMGDSCSVYAGLVQALKKNSMQLDFIFLDGGEEVTAAEFDLLSPMLRVGGVLASHDWFNGKRINKLQEEADAGKWQLDIHGDGSGTFERGSVGFAVAVKLK